MLPQGAFPFLASPVLLHYCLTVASLPPLYALRPFLHPPPVPHGMPDIGTTKR